MLQQYGSALLEGYRLPVASDIKDDWAWFKAERKALPYQVSADFNGDGTPGLCLACSWAQASHRIRFGALVSSGANYRPFRLVDADAGDEFSQRRYCVAVVPPGRYTTAKGLGHNMPGDDPDELVLQHPAIDFIYTESSDIFYYWDAQRNGFRDVAITD